MAVDFGMGMGAGSVTRLIDEAAKFRSYPRAIRTDNGPEFTARSFLAWTQMNKIEHVLIQPDCPLVERVFLLADNERSPQNIVSMRRLIVLGFACASVFFSVSLAAQAVTGRVVGVSDGDTITLLDADKHQHKVRLASIDAPESGQAFGRRSKQTLSDCAFGKQATLTGDKVDRYGRTVSKVMVAGVDCNLRQVDRKSVV